MTPLRVAVCDDSRTYAHALKRFLEHDGDLEVVGTYSSAEDLLTALPVLEADLITMDLELPGLGGLEATQRIMEGVRPVPVVVLSAHATPGSHRAAAALTGGAVDVIPKGELRLTDAGGKDATEVRRQLKRLARARVPPRPARVRTPRPPVRPPRPRRRVPGGPVRAIGIGASTGGPQALARVLTPLPRGFSIPVLVVQHMAPGFTESLAGWLDRQTKVPVAIAQPGEIAGPGVWFAGDGAHLVLDRHLRLGEDRRTVSGRHRPAVDVLFKSMAEALGGAAATVVLTGLGSDGAGGTGAVRAAGGLTIAQDAETSVVDGMPAAARDAGAEVVLGLDDIAGFLGSLTPAVRR